MQAWLRRLLWLERVRPITYLDVEPASLDDESSERVREARGQLASVIVDMERTSYQVRRELADNVLKIVAEGYKP